MRTAANSEPEEKMKVHRLDCQQWITNKMKNMKRFKPVHKWVKTQLPKMKKKSVTNETTNMISNAKKEDKNKRLGSNPNTKTIYATLK